MDSLISRYMLGAQSLQAVDRSVRRYREEIPRASSSSSSWDSSRQDEGLDLQATALKEVWEESGLQVELTGFLMDARRTETLTRYYLARRVGGSPADMGWESQAVHLVPRARLREFLLHEKDRPLLQRLSEPG